MRIFAAIDLPEAIRQRLAILGGGLPGARWVAPESLHLTLRFIGEVDGLGFEDVAEALAGVDFDPFDLSLEGVGHFETARKPHTLWAGVAPSRPLQRLHGSVDMALQRAGLPPEGRKYQPHVTLARLKDTPPGRVSEFLAANATLRTEPFRVDGFTLYSSFLSRSGALYRPEAEFPFGAGTESDGESGDDWDPWHAGTR